MKSTKWVGPKRANVGDDLGAQRIIQRRAQEIERIRMMRNRLLDSKRSVNAAKGLLTGKPLGTYFLDPIEALNGLGSASRQHRVACLQHLRKMYAGSAAEFTSPLVDNRFVQPVLACLVDLQRGEEERIEATCLLACIAASQRPNCQDSIDSQLLQSALPHLAAALTSRNSLQLEYTVWCLGSVAAFSEQHRAAVWSAVSVAGMTGALVQQLTHKVRSTAKTAAWALAQMIGQDASTAESALLHGCSRYCSKWIVKQCELLSTGVNKGGQAPAQRQLAPPGPGHATASVDRLPLLNKGGLPLSHVARSGQAVVSWPISCAGTTCSTGAESAAALIPASILLATVTSAFCPESASSITQQWLNESGVEEAEAVPVLPVPVLDLELVADMLALQALVMHASSGMDSEESRSVLRATLEVPPKGCRLSVVDCAQALCTLIPGDPSCCNAPLCGSATGTRVAVALPDRAGTVALDSLTDAQLLELAQACVESSACLLCTMGMMEATVQVDSTAELQATSPVPWSANSSNGHWLPSSALSPVDGFSSSAGLRPWSWSTVPTPVDRSLWPHTAGTPLPKALSSGAEHSLQNAADRYTPVPFHGTGLLSSLSPTPTDLLQAHVQVGGVSCQMRSSLQATAMEEDEL